MTNDAVDKVRHGEPKRLLKDGDDRLKGSKYFWLTSLENHIACWQKGVSLRPFRDFDPPQFTLECDFQKMNVPQPVNLHP